MEGATIADGGYNLSDDASCNFSAMTSQNSVSDAMLNLDIDGLENNGGPTETIALESPSVAIDQIPLTLCTDANGDPLTTDQRGYGRPAPAPQQSLCDIGAFNSVPSPPLPQRLVRRRPLRLRQVRPRRRRPDTDARAGNHHQPGLGQHRLGRGDVHLHQLRAAPPTSTSMAVFVGYSSYSWNTTKFTNGSHYLLCNGYRNGSYDRKHNQNVTVSNGTPTPTPQPTPRRRQRLRPLHTDADPSYADARVGNHHQPAAGSTVSATVTFTCTTPGGTSNLYIDGFLWGIAPIPGIPRNSPTAAITSFVTVTATKLWSGARPSM